jgi:hypothetical protein
MKMREVRFYEENGLELVAVPLGRASSYEAIIEKSDWEFVRKLGLSGNWSAVPSGYGNPYVAASGSSKNSLRRKVLVARVLLDASTGTSVRFRDGNPLNLRRDNLLLVRSRIALNRDRDWLREAA